jgi:diguanylate cyclase (GGDEF)-like protein
MPISHWNLLSTLTQQAALALERTRLFADAERSAREMTGLYHIGLATTSSLQIDEVVRLIYEQVNRAVRPDTFYIGLYDEDANELSFDLFVENGEALPPFRARLEGGISAWVVRNRKPVFVRNWNKEIEQLPFEGGVVGAPTQSVISVPLMAKSKLVGVMSVQSLKPDAFDQDHLRLLTSIAGQAALALENAKLHAQVFDQAQRDPLTGVFNHGTFIDKLHNLVKDANGNKHTLALVMLDIDRFKQYNDTYGHLVGDDVLRSIVVAIQDHLKSTDIVGRWGGEEFGIVLPEVNRAQARFIAERIRQTAARATLKDMHNRSIPSPTVSQGLAMYPDDATQIEELIDKADNALYRAKELGRNQIAEWIEIEPDHGPISFRARG